MIARGEQARQVLADVTYCREPCDCVTDAVVIVTEWEQFRALDLERLRDLMACPVVVDLRNIYRADDIKKHRFAYSSVGRASTHQPTPIYTPLGQAESLTPTLSGAGTTAP
jgi:UDPglucose 6-dehydrogenase